MGAGDGVFMGRSWRYKYKLMSDKQPFSQVEGNAASVSYRQRPGSSASSASAPRSRSQDTEPASLSAPASSSRSSANRRPPSPQRRGAMPPQRKSGTLLCYLSLRARSHCWSCWRGAHVWEPLVQPINPEWRASKGAAVEKGIRSTCPRCGQAGLRSP